MAQSLDFYEEQSFLGQLFYEKIGEEQITAEFPLVNIRIRVHCTPRQDQHLSHATSSILWAGAQLLGSYLSEENNRCYFTGNAVVELGAGLGIPGILTAKIGAGVACLTDADDSEDYMKTMTLNLQENLERHENQKISDCFFKKLVWSDKNTDLPQLDDIFDHKEQYCQLLRKLPLLILASDVIYFHTNVIAFTNTIAFYLNNALSLLLETNSDNVEFITNTDNLPRAIIYNFIPRFVHAAEQFFNNFAQNGIQISSIWVEDSIDEQSKEDKTQKLRIPLNIEDGKLKDCLNKPQFTNKYIGMIVQPDNSKTLHYSLNKKK
ncbi:MAG: hypothetical protein EZS28_026450 [Streblomastix strix]|uniref:Methyltransferase n=1 Tax=Streblomastix strix TaxID=222440 RepID=A0A5J4V657_9EUKA|nr:MAG: hypothetical protein EZS28_026450 [Streblomastix strix]